jgi:CDGSH-type Zn-finger protein
MGGPRIPYGKGRRLPWWASLLAAAVDKGHTHCFSGEKMAATKITVNSNGSIAVEGDFEIVDPQGQAFGLAGRTIISLCRCGHSANKPFCDGSHKTFAFADTVVARELPPRKPKP